MTERFVRNKNKTITNKIEFYRDISFSRVEKVTFNDLLF